VQQHVLVVAHQVEHPGQAGHGAGAQMFDHAGAVRAAVDVVAQMHQQRRVDRVSRQIGGDPRVQVAQPVEAAVDIADSIYPLSGWQKAGR